jgi:aspartyl aminopeptidase
MNPAESLCRFIDAAPTPAFAATALCEALGGAGFAALDPRAPRWDLPPGGYLVRRGNAVVAFRLRSRRIARLALVGAHVDSPHLHLKPNAGYVCEGCLQLGVEPYGGVLLNSWLDRDLGLAGTVALRDGSLRPVRIHRPLARVAQLAIHLDRRINDDGLKLNPQQHLAPLWGIAGRDADAPAQLRALLAEAVGCPAEAIAGHDLALYDLAPATLGGASNELIFAGRIDNLASCHAGLCALLGAGSGPEDTVPVLACFDHEEVGSETATGAEGPVLAHTLERIALALGIDRQAWLAALAGSLMVSADMAHAVHPNWPDRHEPRHRPRLGGGPVLKSNANQRYATGAAGAARIRALAAEAGVAVQDFVARTDLGCGSTIGPAVAAALGIEVVDLGSPMLSMHSARECAATADHAALIALLGAVLRG